MHNSQKNHCLNGIKIMHKLLTLTIKYTIKNKIKIKCLASEQKYI